MTDRDALLLAILAQPSDHTLRLVYADWLDEFDPSPVGRATSEFIRISCTGNANVMPRKAYKWLRKKWGRLIPCLLRCHSKTADTWWMDDEEGKVMKCPSHKLKGKELQLRVGLQGYNRVYVCRVMIWFWKGFVPTASIQSDWGYKTMMPWLYQDQPILRLKDWQAAQSSSPPTPSQADSSHSAE